MGGLDHQKQMLPRRQDVGGTDPVAIGEIGWGDPPALI